MLYGRVLYLSLCVCGLGLGVCFYLVSISCNISNVGLCVSMYVSFICNLFLLILCIWCCSNVFMCLPFFSVFMTSIVSYFRMCVPCSIYGSSIPNYRCYSLFPVYALYIPYGMLDPSALCISADSPGISSGICHFVHIYLFVWGFLLCFVLYFVF
jgi:hypothetical protein